jgi:hypothetical protein
MANTNFGLPAAPAGVTPAQLGAQNNTIAPEKYKKTFFQTAGGMLLTGGLGALIGMGQRHAEKVKYAKQMEQQGMQNLMNMELAPESQQAYQQSQMLAGQGMDAASKQIAMQEQARGMNLAMSGLRGRRSALAGIPGLNVSSNDFALRMAAQNAMMKRENTLQAIQTGMQYGSQKTALQQAKNEALINKGVAERSRLNQTLTSAITGGAQIAGALLGKPPGA